MRQEELARQAEKERLAYTIVPFNQSMTRRPTPSRMASIAPAEGSVVDRRSPIGVLTISPLHGI